MMDAQSPVDVNSTNSKHMPHGSQPDCAAIQALIPDYAFGLTDKAETQWIENNLDQCAEAVTVLAHYQQMQAIMRADVPQIEPPPRLGQRIMALAAITVPTVAPVSPVSQTVITERTAEAPRPLQIASTAPAEPPLGTRRPHANRWAGWLAAAVILLALSNTYWLARLNGIGVRSGLTPVTVTATANNGLVVNTVSTLHWVHLPASTQTGKASAYLMWNAESKIGLLYVHDFPVLPAGQTYQLWLTRGQAHLSAGTFTVDQTGKGALLFSTEMIDQYTWSRITVESQGGSDTPDGVVVVVGQLL